MMLTRRLYGVRSSTRARYALRGDAVALVRRPFGARSLTSLALGRNQKQTGPTVTRFAPATAVLPGHGCFVTSVYGSSTSNNGLSGSQTRKFLLSTLADVHGPHGSYKEEHASALRDPKAFWSRAANQLDWHTKPTTVFEQGDAPHFIRWFPDGKINLSYNCLDVQVQSGRGKQDALIYDSPLTGGVKERYTYEDLLEQVSTLAGALREELGVETGDRVVIYMPMIPQAAVAMLACARIGAIHSVVFGGFASKELATRIRDCQPKVVLTASVGVEPTRTVPYKPLLDKALEMAADGAGGESPKVVLVQRHNVETCDLGPNDVDYDELMGRARPIEAIPLPSNHLQHILYTSGTTGLPKGVVRDTGPWTTALKYSMTSFYDTNPGETMWAASDIGWIVGHAYIVYAPLLGGCTSIMYEGKPVGTPDAGAFWRVIQEYQVKTLFVAPTAFRAIKQADPHAELAEKYDLSSLKTLFLAGEHSDPDTLHYCEHALAKYGKAKEAIDHWWQTELGWPAVGNAVGLGRIPIRHGACTGPVPGYDLKIVDDAGKEIQEPHKLGNMVLGLPLPPGTLTTVYNNNDERYVQEYMTRFPGYYDTADAAFFDEEGFVHIVGRVDDVINTAGHRLSSGAMEEMLMEHEEVADCAVFPIRDEVKGEVPVGLVVKNKGSTIEEEQLRSELKQLVRDSLGPVAVFKLVASVKQLPKTRSGKILRGTMSNIANGEPYSITPTIEDPKVFEALEPQILELVGKEN